MIGTSLDVDTLNPFSDNCITECAMIRLNIDPICIIRWRSNLLYWAGRRHYLIYILIQWFWMVYMCIKIWLMLWTFIIPFYSVLIFDGMYDKVIEYNKDKCLDKEKKNKFHFQLTFLLELFTEEKFIFLGKIFFIVSGETAVNASIKIKHIFCN